MPVDVSFYGAQPQAAPNLLQWYNQGAQGVQHIAQSKLIDANTAEKQRENEDAKLLNEVLAGASKNGKFDFTSAVNALASHPRLASKAPEYALKAAQYGNINSEIASRTLTQEAAKHSMLAQAAGGALTQAMPQPDGSLGLDMAPLTQSAAQLSASAPHLRDQVGKFIEQAAGMDPSARYKMVEQLARSGMTLQQQFEQMNGKFAKTFSDGDGNTYALDGKTGESKLVAKGVPKPTIVPQGATAVGPDGKVLYASEPKDTALEARMAAIRASGVKDESLVQAIASGRLEAIINPTTGEKSLMDKATGEPFNYDAFRKEQPGGVPSAPAPATPSAPPIAQNAAAVPAPAAPTAAAMPVAPQPRVPPTPPVQPPVGGAIDLYNKQSQAQGVVPALKEAATEVLPQISENLPGVMSAARSIPGVGKAIDYLSDSGKDIVKQRQILESAASELVSTLRTTTRLSEGERKQLEKDVSLRPGWGSTTAMRGRMEALDTTLRARQIDEQRAALDKTLPAKERSDAATLAKDIGNFLRKMNVPQGTSSAAAAPTPSAASVQYFLSHGNDPAVAKQFVDRYGEETAKQLLSQGAK